MKRKLSGLYTDIPLHKEINGVNFNKKYSNKNFYKFLYNDLTHYGFRYKLGMNIDKNVFDPSGVCSKGGLYFCEESQCYNYWNNYGSKVALIKIPDDARVYIEEHKFKADKLIITQILKFDDIQLDNMWISITGRFYHAFTRIQYPSKEICIFVVKQNGLFLQYVKNQTGTSLHEICSYAVQQNGDALEFVENQTDELCMLAVKQNGYALQYVGNQTEDICILAVKQNGYALQYVGNQTEDICILAVKQNWRSFQKVITQTNDICELAVRQNGLVLVHVKKQTKNICLLAVKQNGLALQFVEERFKTKDVCDLAIKQHNVAVTFVNQRKVEVPTSFIL